jgi:5,10-methylenetetrahydrofolate reductase
MMERSLINKIGEFGGVSSLFEVLPPRGDTTEEKIRSWCERIGQAAETLPFLAINIPEVLDESRDGQRTYSYVPHMEPRVFAQHLRPYLPDAVEIIINRVVVHSPLAKQKEWIRQTYHDYDIRQLVLVGGESSQVEYPGPSVALAAQTIREQINPELPKEQGVRCGAICIPTRRSTKKDRDESQRLINKTKAGISFFSSQLIYEASHTCDLLKTYDELCKKQAIAPRPIFISLAPLSQKKHIDFVKWLGVSIPDALEERLLQVGDTFGEESLKVCEQLFKEILIFKAKNNLHVPLGLNISYLIRSNFDLSLELAKRLNAL